MLGRLLVLQADELNQLRVEHDALFDRDGPRLRVRLRILDGDLDFQRSEVHSAEARQWRSGSNDLHTLAVFFEIEIANILWKRIRRGDVTRTQADAYLVRLPLLAMTRHPDGPIVASAFDMADRTQRTVYDCLYLALAVQLGGQMVTADDKLVNSLAGTPWAGSILRLQDVP